MKTKSSLSSWAPVLGLTALGCAVLAAKAAEPAGIDPVAETERYLAMIPPADRARSDAYFEGGYWLLLWNLVVTLALTVAFYTGGLFARLRNWAEGQSQRRIVQGGLFISGYLVLMWTATLPWEFYTGYLREHQYALSNMNAGEWLFEQALGLVVTLVAGCVVGLPLYHLIRRFPIRWWRFAGLAAPILVLLFLMIYPVVIEPLFNDYQPVADARVRQSIISLARANGVLSMKVCQYDESKQSQRINANVAGALGTTRIALNDNLLNRCSLPEVRAVVAHELGHHVLHHIARDVVVTTLLAWFCLAGLRWSFGAVWRCLGADWGVRGIDDYAGAPLLIALVTLFVFLVTPLANTLTRTAEIEADLFGLNAGREPDGFATVVLKTVKQRKAQPGALEEAIFYDHPSPRSRILAAMRWKAENINLNEAKVPEVK